MSKLSYALKVPHGSNFFEFNMVAFSLASDELTNKTILDVGSSLGIFARHTQGLGTKIIALDPLYRNTKQAESVAAILEVDAPEYGIKNICYPPVRNPVCGLVQELPFANSSFDHVLSYSAVPIYLPVCDYEQSIDELMRVLKPRGQARLAPFDSAYYPVGSTHRHSYQHFNAAEFEKVLQEKSIEYSILSYHIKEVNHRDSVLVITKPQ